MRIDAHQHFWRFSQAAYTWIGADMHALRRDWMPTDLQPLLASEHIDGCVAVQARTTETETDFLLDLAGQHAFIAAVIGWVDLAAGDLEQRLDRWQRHQRLAGFRHPVQDEADAAGWLGSRQIGSAVRLLQSRQYVYELLVYSRQIGPAAAFAARHDRHWLVLDHLGKPAMRADDHADWRRSILPLRSQAHVMCKISGLVTEAAAPDGSYDALLIERYLDTALDIFGAGRLMYGSDWPVCLQVATYPNTYGLVRRWAARLSASEQAALWGGTAARCYELEAVQGSASTRTAATWT